jgi:anthranilate phosphoribosyltransferase
VLSDLINKLRNRRNLTKDEIVQAVAFLIDDKTDIEEKAGFLIALSQKGETVDEIWHFAEILRGFSISPPIDESLRTKPLIDVCGTGGDKLGTFNISTTVAIIVSSADVVVVKHGNRAATSKSGSADVLESLGIKTALSPEESVEWLKKYNFAFFFAPLFHPAFKNIAPARRLAAERGYRTIFNYLGPLLNPARPNCQLIGVPNPDICEPVARALQCMGVKRGMVVCGKIQSSENKTVTSNYKYIDEISASGPTFIAEFYQENALSCSEINFAEITGLFANAEDLKGGDSKTNAEIIVNILSGKERGAKRDVVLLNCAAAFLVASKVKSIIDGIHLAEELIESGIAYRKLKQLVEASKQ